MPKLTNVVIKDAKQVDRTFTPQSSDNGLSLFRERVGAVIAQPSITFSMKESKATGTIKSSLKLTMPITALVVDPVSGATVTRKISEPLVNTQFVVNDGMTIEQKQELHALHSNALLNALFADAMTKSEMILG